MVFLRAWPMRRILREGFDELASTEPANGEGRAALWTIARLTDNLRCREGAHFPQLKTEKQP